MAARPLRAVIFDVGGVVVDSPLHVIAAYERELGIPEGLVNRTVVANGPEGAWARLERGELALPDFFEAFDRECEEAGPRFSAREMMARIASGTAPRPRMLAALARIRDRGLRVGALTNNWPGEEDGLALLRPHFDAVVESRLERVRKPDLRIYRIACTRLAVEPPEAAFLDDIGRNLKAARELGMATIKVEDPDAALAELGTLLGFELTDPHGVNA